MRKITYLLILLAFFGSATLFAKEPKKLEEASYHYKKDSLDYWEWLQTLKDHMNHLQTVPLVDNENIEFELGPAQFQMTIPFR